MCHLNSQSLMPKLDEVKLARTSAQRPVILGLSEMWLDSSVMDGEVSHSVYQAMSPTVEIEDAEAVEY